MKEAEKDTTLQIVFSANASISSLKVPAGFENAQILPNTCGRGYGLFTLSDKQLTGLLNYLQQVQDGTARFALLSLLHENYLACKISDTDWLHALLQALPQEKDALTASTLTSYIGEPLRQLQGQERAEVEEQLWALSSKHPLYSTRVQILRSLSSQAQSQGVTDHLYSLWENQSNELLGLTDYMTLSYELAIRMPSQAKQILDTQRARIENPDRLRQFDFVSRAAVSDTLALDTLFNSLITNPQARRIEPWKRQLLSLLNHPLREAYSVKYITPALEALEDVQRTGDIFFPGHWCTAVLNGHRSQDAYQEVKNFIDTHPDYLQLRLNKILLGSYGLFRVNGNRLF